MLKYVEFLTDLYLSVKIVPHPNHLIEILSIIMPRLTLFLVTILIFYYFIGLEIKEIVKKLLAFNQAYKWEFLCENYFQ